MNQRSFARAAVAVLVIRAMLGTPSAEARAKVDVIVLSNGDTITCEIKKLERGILEVKAPYTKGSINIEWRHVESVTSSQLFEFETEDGRRFYGAMQASDTAREVYVYAGVGMVGLAHDEVVRIAQIEEHFWDRTKGSLDVGFTAKKANSQTDFNVGGKFDYRTRRYLVSSNLSSLLSARDDTDSNTRQDFSIQYNRFLRKKYFAVGFTSFESNSELDLDLRTTLGGGYGRFLRQTNRNLITAVGGLAGNQERYGNTEDVTTNLEGVLAFDYQLFLFAGNETDFRVNLTVLPSLSSRGRVRSNLDTRLRRELISDFYVSLSLFASVDSRPPSESQRFDWNFVSSLGWSW